MQSLNGINYELLERYCAGVNQNIVMARNFERPGEDECLYSRKCGNVCRGCTRNKERSGTG